MSSKLVSFCLVFCIFIHTHKMTCNVACAGNVCISTAEWNLTADLGHVTGGCLFMLGPTVLLRRWIHPTWTTLVLSVVWFAFVYAKELWYDPAYETTTEQGSAATDILTYLGGWVLGVALALSLDIPTMYDE